MNKTEERAKEALEEIVNPIKFMRDSLQEGEQLNGGYAAMLANDANYLRNIAKKALDAIAGATEAQDDWKRVEDELPDEDCVVQVYDACLYWLNHISQGYVKNGNWRIKYDCPHEAGEYISYYVTHWRNLPSPPSNDKP